MKSEVEKAVTAIRKHYRPLTVEVFESSCGGAYVLVHDVALGAPYKQDSTWVGFFPRGSLKTGHRGSLQNRPTITIIQGVDFDARAATLGRCEQCLERGKETASYRIGAVGLVAAEDSEDQRRSARNGR